MGGTACRGPCYQGRQHPPSAVLWRTGAVPPPCRNEFPLLPSPLRFDAIPASHRAVAQRRRVGERERVRGGSRPQLHRGGNRRISCRLRSRSVKNLREGWSAAVPTPFSKTRLKHAKERNHTVNNFLFQSRTNCAKRIIGEAICTGPSAGHETFGPGRQDIVLLGLTPKWSRSTVSVY